MLTVAKQTKWKTIFAGILKRFVFVFPLHFNTLWNLFDVDTIHFLFLSIYFFSIEQFRVYTIRLSKVVYTRKGYIFTPCVEFRVFYTIRLSKVLHTRKGCIFTPCVE